jgi:acetolactate synthase I/II/III large subunit
VKITGSEILVKCLIEEGVGTVFGHPGGIVLHVAHLLGGHGVRTIFCRHEQAATLAAEGYYKATGQTGTVMVGSGSGVTNCATAMTDALVDSMAVVVLAGQVPVGVMGRDADHDADVVGTTLACTKHNFLVRRTGELPRSLKEAYHIARSGRPGPVLVDVPQDVLTGRAEFAGYPKSVSIRGYNPQVVGHPGQIRRAADVLARATRPLIYGGGGIIHADAAPEFQELVDLTQIPTTLTLMGLGALPTDDLQWLGMPGMHGVYWANKCMTECDVLLTIGCRFNDRVTGKRSEFGSQCKIIHVDIDPASIQKHVKVDVPIVGDVKVVLRDLTKEIRKLNRDWAADLAEWYGQIETWKKQRPLRYEQRAGMIKPQYAIDMIFRLTEEFNPIVSTGVGQHQMWAAQVYRGRTPRRWLTSGGLATMGYGLPAALGAQAAFPDSLVLNIDGDGSCQVTIADLATLVEHNLPVKTFIINNKALGMVRQWRQHMTTHHAAPVEFRHHPDFVRIAEAYGILGIRIERPDEVKAGVEKAINTPGPVVVDVVVDPAESCLPMDPTTTAARDVAPSDLWPGPQA